MKTIPGLMSENAALRERAEISFRRIEELQRILDGIPEEQVPRARLVTRVHLPKRRRRGGRPSDGQSARTPPAWASEGPARPLSVAPGLPNLSLQSGGVPNVLVSVCGFDDDALRAVIDTVLERQTFQRDFAPIFITDSLSFHLFRRYGFAFEYFPLRPERQAVGGTRSWAEYADARLALLMRKYGVSRVLTFGEKSLKLPAEA
jgi:hypothetical protein